MLKRHSDVLENILDQLAHEPLIKISKKQLRYLYGAERLSKNTYRDLFERLPEFIPLEQLNIIEDGDDLFIIKKTELKDALSLT